MNKHDIIQSFFVDQMDYIDFLISKKQVIIASDSGEYFAELKKDEDCFLYTLTYTKDGKFVGDYVIPFKATVENIQTFNDGCKIIAERLIKYVETGNINAVPSKPPAFGSLTYHKG